MLGWFGRSITHHIRDAFVAAFAQLDEQWDRTEERYFKLRCGFLATTAREDVITRPGVGRDEEAHVLDDPKHRNIDALEHLQSFTSIRERDVLRCRDDH